MLNIALPKGRLGDDVYKLFAEIGYDCGAMLEDNRKLIFVSEDEKVAYFLVKPVDVGIYVARGAADIGVIGKDTLLETELDVFELLDLKMGKCRMCVAAQNGWVENEALPLRVATKYTNITRRYYGEKNREIDIIKLNGSIELAPLLGLSDVIVDIVETGTTLRENNLSVVAEVAKSSARLIANKSSYQFKKQEIDRMVKELEVKL